MIENCLLQDGWIPSFPLPLCFEKFIHCITFPAVWQYPSDPFQESEAGSGEHFDTAGLPGPAGDTFFSGRKHDEHKLHEVRQPRCAPVWWSTG